MKSKTTITNDGDRWTIETDQECHTLRPVVSGLKTVFGGSLAAAEMIGFLHQELMDTRERVKDLGLQLLDINVQCEECGFEYHHKHYEEDRPCPECQAADYQDEIKKLKESKCPINTK